MLALFVLMIVPVCGWYFIGDLASGRLLAALPEASHEQVNQVQHEIRFKLAITLGLSVVVLGAVVGYVRRTLLDPLEHLAVTARRSDTKRWLTPPETERSDEVGDLARALDSSVSALQVRAEEAESFAANLSHELRSPLAAIRGAGEILGEEDLSLEDRQHFAANILAESLRLERLIAGLLALARAERQTSEVQRVELLPLVQQVVELHQPRLAEQETTLQVQAEQASPLVVANTDIVIRILTILVENAMEHTPLGGAIVIGLRNLPGFAEVRVQDSGCGVPIAARDRIFDRWYALSGESRQGSGLGLAIARGLVERMGGELALGESELGGAAFFFTIPLWSHEPAETHPAPPGAIGY